MFAIETTVAMLNFVAKVKSIIKNLIALIKLKLISFLPSFDLEAKPDLLKVNYDNCILTLNALDM